MSAYQIIDSTSEIPLVSIAMLTYNHQDYIVEALDSVLMQKTKFSFKIILAEDQSTDKTRAIILDYQREYPDIIKLILQNENVGASKNNISLFENLEGKYIAALEGDDYWTDPLKLQKQVDFLENNPGYNFSMGRVDILIDKTGVIKKKTEPINPHKREFFTIRDYLKKPFSQTSSFVFLNDMKSLPEWFSDVHAGDQSLVVIKTGLYGKIKYHTECLSIYRINENSITAKADYDSNLKLLDTVDFWQKHLNYNYKFIFILIKYKYKQISVYYKYKNYLWKLYILSKVTVTDIILKAV